MGIALVIWTATMITTSKKAGHSGYHIAHTGNALEHFFKAIPWRTQVNLMCETLENWYAITHSFKSERQCFRPEQFTHSPQWPRVRHLRANTGIVCEARMLWDEEFQAITYMRQVSIRQAYEVLESGVGLMGHSPFLARGFSRRETAWLTRFQGGCHGAFRRR
jgi:hypothetical protein